MHNYLTIIPARKNSLRFKNKNVKLFNKKPLIEYTFDLVKKVKKLDFTVLTSNDQKAIKLAKKKKILVPFNILGNNIKEILSKKLAELPKIAKTPFLFEKIR